MKRHGCNLHTYADDNQVYVHCRHSVSVTAAAKLERCVKEVGSQMASNLLTLNPSKTKLMWFDTKHEFEKRPPATVNINSVVINPVKSAKSVSVTVDDELNLVNHVATVCRSSYYQIRHLKHIRRYLDFDSASTLVHSCFTSRIDYCNSLLASTPAYQIYQLQHVLNAAARLLLRISSFDGDL